MPATAAARRAAARPARKPPARPARRTASRPTGKTARASARRPTARAARSRARSRGVTPASGFLIPVAVGQRTALAVGDLADSGLVVRLTRSRLWILLLAALLVGIVALNVLSLSLSASSSRMARQADAVERETSALRAKLANVISGDKVDAAAARLGLALPEPARVSYLDASPDDAEVAAKRLLEGELSAP